MKNCFVIVTAGLLLASPVLAQTATPAAPSGNMAPATDAAPAGSAGASNMAPATGAMGGDGMMMGDSATVAVKFVQVSPADVMTSKLDGADVYNNQNENIGEIEDIVIKDGKTISGVVVSVGGFLGIGDRYVLLDPSSIMLADQNGTLRAMVNTSKNELTKAPEFKYTKRD